MQIFSWLSPTMHPLAALTRCLPFRMRQASRKACGGKIGRTELNFDSLELFYYIELHFEDPHMAKKPASGKASQRLATQTDLSGNAVPEIAEALNGLVADSYALYTKTKNFH